MSKDDPHFPPDLEREIFETAAEMRWEDVPELLLVARRVHEWLEPFLYRNIYISEHTISTAEEFLGITASKSPEFLARAVRRVTIQFGSIPAESELLKIYSGLRLCTGITGLAFGSNNDSVINNVVPLLAHMRLQRLVCTFEQIVTPKPDLGPLLRFLTHLDICDPQPEEDSELIQLLVTLPALTHLSLNSGAPDWSFVKDLLHGCPRLEILVLLVGESGPPPREITLVPVEDPRFVLSVFSRWEEGLSDGADELCYWQAAENLVQRKRLGLIPKNQFWTGDFHAKGQDDE
ncbi:hypothetical protein C8F01DRAFT_1231973 [Mycena amicta]|nr:hypothetical protein C8F01DRAFT_1231973 [Mycena amicta]